MRLHAAMNRYLTNQVKYIFCYPQEFFNLPNICNTVSLLTFLLSLVYLCCVKIGQGFKERRKTRVHQWNRIFNSIWQIGCYMFMVVLCAFWLSARLPSAEEDISIQESNQTSEVAFSLICAILLHSAFLSFKYSGFNRISVRGVVATIALCLSYGAKCLKIGVTFVVIWSVPSLVTEIICLSICIAEIIYKKTVGEVLSLWIAAFFSAIWIFFYLYLYPLFILLPVSALNSTNSSISFVSLLLLTLWSEYILDWCSTPFVRFLWMSTTRSFPSNWLSFLFIVQKNDVTEKLLLIRKGQREKELSPGNQLVQGEEMKTRKKSQTMIQTIRCVLLLKKKLRRMRERKSIELSDELK